MPSSDTCLVPSIITSSSILPLVDFFQEVQEVHDTENFDLLVLRPEDADQLDLHGGRITDLVVYNFSQIKTWFEKRFQEWHQNNQGRSLRFPALATYFPDIASMSENLRVQARQAIENCVKLCHAWTEDLKKWNIRIEPCVEIVCGSLLEPRDFPDGDKNQKWVIQYKRGTKIKRLISSLQEVKENLKELNFRYAVALELEPGDAYLLNDKDSLKQVRDAIRTASLDDIVGFNLDIAHYKIADISAGWLGENDFTHSIVHSHIADHPIRMHTRDQAIGTFTDVEHWPTGYCEYLDLLMSRAEASRANSDGLLFTNAVALELEGCSRMSWIHNSIPHMKRLLMGAYQRRYGASASPAAT